MKNRTVKWMCGVGVALMMAGMFVSGARAQDQDAKPLIILMHGDRQVSLKNLARQVGAKKVEPSKANVAQRHSGYQVGGTSPFGLRKSMPIYVERSILDLPEIYINGGRRGYLVKLPSRTLTDLLAAQLVDCASIE